MKPPILWIVVVLIIWTKCLVVHGKSSPSSSSSSQLWEKRRQLLESKAAASRKVLEAKAAASRKVLEAKRRQLESKAQVLEQTLQEKSRQFKSKASSSLEYVEGKLRRGFVTVWGTTTERNEATTIGHAEDVSEADYLEERLVFKHSLTNKFGGTFLVTFGMFVSCMVRAALILMPQLLNPTTTSTDVKFELRYLQWVWGLGVVANCFNFLSIILLLRSFNNYGRGYSLSTAETHNHHQPQRQEVVIRLLEEYQEVRLGTIIHTVVALCIFCGFDILRWFFYRSSNNNGTETITIGRISIPKIPAVICGCLVVISWMMVASDRDDGPGKLLSQLYKERVVAAAADTRRTMNNNPQQQQATNNVRYKNLWNLLLSTLMRAGWAVLVFLLTCPTTTTHTTP